MHFIFYATANHVTLEIAEQQQEDGGGGGGGGCVWREQAIGVRV